METSVLPVEVPVKEETPFRRFVSEFAESKLALIGLAMLLLVLTVAILAPVISPQNPYDLGQIDLMDSKLAPGEKAPSDKVYRLGTDDQGRDMLSAIFYGLRISLTNRRNGVSSFTGTSTGNTLVSISVSRSR